MDTGSEDAAGSFASRAGRTSSSHVVHFLDIVRVSFPELMILLST